MMDSSSEETKTKSTGLLSWILRFFIMLMIPLLLAVGSARIIMTPTFLAFEYNRPNFSPDRYGMSQYDRLNYGPYGVLYIIDNEPIEYLGDLELPGELCYPPDDRPCPAFNSQELSHMHDVQVVAQALFTFALWGGLITLIVMVFLARNVNLFALRLALLQGSILTIGLIIAIILIAITAWDTFFSGFHSLFFEDGTWQFFYSDTLIRLYPEQFWFDASLAVGILTTVGALILLGIGLRLPSRL